MEPDDEKQLVEALQAVSVLGSGSNGCVLEVVLPSMSCPPGAIPVDTSLALKVVGHFWDESAQALLASEALVFQRVPPHRNVVHLYAQFQVGGLCGAEGTIVHCRGGAAVVVVAGFVCGFCCL